MFEIKKILAVIDLEEDRHPALERGALLARKWDAELELFVCHYDQYLSGERFFDSAGLARARADALSRCLKQLDVLAAPLVEEGLSVATDVVWDTPLDEGIVRKVLRSEPDLVVKTTEFHHKLSRALFTHSDWNLIRTCPAPLWLAKSIPWIDDVRIVASVDPLHEHDKPASLDRKIIQIGQVFADRLAGDLHVFHAFNPVIVPASGAVAPDQVALPIDKVERRLEELHRSSLSRLTDEFGIPAANVHLRVGKTVGELDDLVEDVVANVVIMGAVARNPFARVFIGSTAEKVLDKLSCGVLIVKPDGFVTPVHDQTVEEESESGAHQIAL